MTDFSQQTCLHSFMGEVCIHFLISDLNSIKTSKNERKICWDVIYLQSRALSSCGVALLRVQEAILGGGRA